jgi:hypothetical protein
MRTVADEKLLRVPARWTSTLGDWTTRVGGGMNRILRRGEFETLITPRGGGAYWSFAKRSNSYDEEPDLELQNERWHSGFYGGNKGWLLDLGEVPIESVEPDPQRPPHRLSEEDQKLWDFLWTERPADGGYKERRDIFLRETMNRSRDSVPAVAGHTYLLRSILEEEHDVLVVFRDLERDDHGRTLVWRVLRQWELPVKRRR